MTTCTYDLIKCSIIGDCNVGKTTIIDKYFNNNRDSTNNCTIGAIYWSLSNIINNKKIKLNLWDTAGQEKYSSLIPMYTRSCDILILTFDLTNKKTLYNLEKWFKLTESNLKLNYIIVGNKKDQENLIQVSDEMINDFTSNVLKLNIPLIKTSAKSGENIEILFEKIFQNAYNILERRTKFEKPSSDYISLNADINEKKNCCY